MPCQQLESYLSLVMQHSITTKRPYKYHLTLRAPERDRVGLVPDDTSSQHGRHTFRFALLPYAGTILRTGRAPNEGVDGEGLWLIKGSPPVDQVYASTLSPAQAELYKYIYYI